MSFLWQPGTWIGYSQSNSSVNGDFSLNSADARIAQSFIPNFGGTGWSIAFYIASIGGSPQQEDVVVELWSEYSNGKPSSLIESRTLGSGALTTGRKVVSGWTASLTKRTRYFIVIRNANTAPATNYFSIRVMERGMGNDGATSLAAFTSSDGGSTWTVYGTARNNLQVIDSSGATDVYLLANALPTMTVSSTLIPGVGFTVPSNVRLVVNAVVCFNITAASGPYLWRIVSGASTIAETVTMQRTSNNQMLIPFSSDVTLDPGNYECQFIVQSGTAAIRRVDIDTTLLPTGFPYEYRENGTPVSSRMFSQWFLRLKSIEGISGGGFPFPPHSVFLCGSGAS